MCCSLGFRQSLVNGNVKAEREEKKQEEERRVWESWVEGTGEENKAEPRWLSSVLEGSMPLSLPYLPFMSLPLFLPPFILSLFVIHITLT